MLIHLQWMSDAVLVNICLVRWWGANKRSRKTVVMVARFLSCKLCAIKYTCGGLISGGQVNVIMARNLISRLAGPEAILVYTLGLFYLRFFIL